MAKGKQNKGPARDRYHAENHQSKNKKIKAERHLKQIAKWAARASDPAVKARKKANAERKLAEKKKKAKQLKAQQQAVA